MDAYEKGVSLLSVREHTEKELREKLGKRFSPEDIDEAVALLKQKGYLSDRRYADVFLRSRMRRSPEGRPLLLCRLREKGVGEEDAAEALSLFWEEGQYAEPLMKSYRSLVRKKGKEKARASLLMKGFTESEVRSVASKVDDEGEE